MDKTIGQIHQVLTRLTGLHRQLLEIVRHEREVLVQAEVKAIQDTLTQKQVVIDMIRQTEVERVRATGELALRWRRPVKELSLSQIIIQVQGDDPKAAEQLRSALNVLTLLIQRVQEQNEYNRGLVEKSLEHVHQMKRNVLGESMPKANTYTPKGERSPGPGNSRLLSREA